MSKQEITMSLDIEDGYEFVEHRPPRRGERYIEHPYMDSSSVALNHMNTPRFVIKKKHTPPVLVTVVDPWTGAISTKEDRMELTGKVLKVLDGVTVIDPRGHTLGPRERLTAMVVEWTTVDFAQTIAYGHANDGVL